MWLPTARHGEPEADDSGDADDDDRIVVVTVGANNHQGLTMSQEQGQAPGCQSSLSDTRRTAMSQRPESFCCPKLPFLWILFLPRALFC